MSRAPVDPKAAKAAAHAKAARDAAARIVAALKRGEQPTLDDAKVLEAAGCYLRRNGAKR